LFCDRNSGSSQPAQTNWPLRFSALSGLEPGRSVPSWRSTAYQQRSRGRLSGGGAGARCHRENQQRSISADEFFKGLFSTALDDGEIITAVSFPVQAKAGYSKFNHPASRFALTGVFVAKTRQVTSASPRPVPHRMASCGCQPSRRR